MKSIHEKRRCRLYVLPVSIARSGERIRNPVAHGVAEENNKAGERYGQQSYRSPAVFIFGKRLLLHQFHSHFGLFLQSHTGAVEVKVCGFGVHDHHAFCYHKKSHGQKQNCKNRTHSQPEKRFPSLAFRGPLGLNFGRLTVKEIQCGLPGRRPQLLCDGGEIPGLRIFLHILRHGLHILHKRFSRCGAGQNSLCCFQKAGFDKQRLFYTQGDYGLWQCSIPCHQKTYDNEDEVKEMMKAQKNMQIPTELIPHCPICGKPMTMNLRCDDRFVEDEGWHQAMKRYSDFLHHHRKHNILFLELGVGANTPAIIKYPFWRMTAQNPSSIYACVNFKEAFAPTEISNRSICLQADIGDVLLALRTYKGIHNFHHTC